MVPLRGVHALFAAFAVWLLGGCSGGETKVGCRCVVGPDGAPRQVARRLYRADLDGRQGLLLYAADTARMTLAYDTVRCGLYEAWRGPVEAGMRDIGIYTPQGPLYHRREADTLWRVARMDSLGNGEDTLAAKPRFLGFDEDTTGSPTFHYALDLADGTVIRVDESPSYYDHYGDVTLRTDFDFQGLRPGMAVSVRMGGKAFAWKELWDNSANGTLSHEAGKETLTVQNDGVADVRLIFEGSAF